MVGDGANDCLSIKEAVKINIINIIINWLINWMEESILTSFKNHN